MKKIIRLVLASILGIAFIFLLNLLTEDRAVSGISLPFGWDGPLYILTEDSPNEHSSGLPFMMTKYSGAEGAYYESLTGLSLNIVNGISLGLGGSAIIQKIKKRTK